MAAIKMAQYGTKHGHASGKLLAMQRNENVEMVGVFEPDSQRRAELEGQDGPFAGVRWFDNKEEMLEDGSIAAIASEGDNHESLGQTEEIVEAGKHVWYDKPGGDDWAHWLRVVERVQEKKVYLQMGYMLRYSPAFSQVAEWVRSGFLGDIFSLRAHMSTYLPAATLSAPGKHVGGIFYDLASHMLDQVVWLMGRPQKVTSFLRHDSVPASSYVDNGLGVFEFERGIAFIDIAAMETRPAARCFEVYGTNGSAIITEPFEPGKQIRLCLDQARGGYQEGVQTVTTQGSDRQELYELALVAFLKTIQGEQEPDRPLEHEVLVQETLLRSTGGIAEAGV